MEYSYHSRFRRPSTLLAAAIGLFVLTLGIMQGVAWYWLALVAAPLVLLMVKLFTNATSYLTVSEDWVGFESDGHGFSALKAHIQYIQLPTSGAVSPAVIVMRDGTNVTIPDAACPKPAKLERELSRRGYEIQRGGASLLPAFLDDSFVS